MEMMCFILRGLKIMSEPSVDEEANAAHLLPSDVPYVHYGTGTVRMRTGRSSQRETRNYSEYNYISFHCAKYYVVQSLECLTSLVFRFIHE